MLVLTLPRDYITWPSGCGCRHIDATSGGVAGLALVALVCPGAVVAAEFGVGAGGGGSGGRGGGGGYVRTAAIDTLLPGVHTRAGHATRQFGVAIAY